MFIPSSNTVVCWTGAPCPVKVGLLHLLGGLPTSGTRQPDARYQNRQAACNVARASESSSITLTGEKVLYWRRFPRPTVGRQGLHFHGFAEGAYVHFDIERNRHVGRHIDTVAPLGF